MNKRRWFVPEVIQTSATDCGPAVLKAILEGYGVPVRLDRLREACSTDVDGTSFDTLEDLLERYGFSPDKALVPPEDLFYAKQEQLPAVVVTRLPNGFAHFVLAWRRFGNHLLLMDPANGRRWIKVRDFLGEVFIHQMPIDATHLRSWLEARPSFRDVMADRLSRLGNNYSLLDRVGAEADTRTVIALDAAARTVAALVQRGAIPKGKASADLTQSLFELAAPIPLKDERFIPAQYWAAVPTTDKETYMLRGVPIIRISPSPKLKELVSIASEEAIKRNKSPSVSAMVSSSLGSVYGQATPPLVILAGLLPRRLKVSALMALGLSLLASVFEVITALTLGQFLAVYTEVSHSAAVAEVAIGLITLCTIVWLLDATCMGIALRVGRNLDIRFRAALLQSLPTLPDAYFRTRAGSDLAERFHTLHVLRKLPEIAMHWSRIFMLLCAAYVGLAWLFPSRILDLSAIFLIGVAIPLFLQRPIAELDMRARTHGGALATFYLDALLGGMAIKAHRAEKAMAVEQERLVAGWGKAQRTLARFSVQAELVVTILGMVLLFYIVFSMVSQTDVGPTFLLATYWVLSIPLLSNELAIVTRHVSIIRNQIVRMIEPLDLEIAPTEDVVDRRGAVAIDIISLTVRTSPKLALLEDINLNIASGSKVAVVGSSGSGKSTLAGVLLGLYVPESGKVFVDGEELTPGRIASLRARTAWVDPTANLWNRSIAENITYGHENPRAVDLSWLIKVTELEELLNTSDLGLQTSMGEAGARFSGGEGQRVRLARSLVRQNADLVILDEPFRGLDRTKRRRLLRVVLSHWHASTIVCVTHDLTETFAFDTVVVLERGRVIEQGAPRDLAGRRSRYRTLLEKEKELDAFLWKSSDWKHKHLKGGTII